MSLSFTVFKMCFYFILMFVLSIPLFTCPHPIINRIYSCLTESQCDMIHSYLQWNKGLEIKYLNRSHRFNTHTNTRHICVELSQTVTYVSLYAEILEKVQHILCRIYYFMQLSTVISR